MKTAIATPTDPFEELLQFIDAMTFLELLRFNLKLRLYLIGKIAGEAGL